MDSLNPKNHIAPHDSIQMYRYAVMFENEALWREKDPIARANIALQLSEFAATLAKMEVAEAMKFTAQNARSEAV